MQIFKTPELRKKVLIVGFLLMVFRVFATIPIPSVDFEKLKMLLSSSQLLGLFDLFSGGGISSLSVVMLGVGPYITATIVMQLLTMVFPYLKEIYYEQGEMGRAKFNRISRYLTVPLAALQGFGFLNFSRRIELEGSLEDTLPWASASRMSTRASSTVSFADRILESLLYFWIRSRRVS